MNHPNYPLHEQNNPLLRLRALPFVQKVEAFLYTPAYIFMVGAMALAANLYALELPVYCCYIFIAVYISFFGRDYLPILPLVVFSYISPSVANNPGRNENSIFFGATGAFIIGLAGIFVLSLIIRLTVDPQIGRKAFFTHKRKLLPGILALGVAYLLAGAGSGHYWAQGYSNLLFAAIQFLSIFLLYFVLSGAVQWQAAPANYLAWTGLCAGFVLLGEILGIFATGAVIQEGEFLRENIHTGWGHYNNIGAFLAMMIPFAFQLACVRKHSWCYYLCGVAFLIGLFLTCSRTSILFGCCTYGVSCLVVFFKSRKRRAGLVTNILSIAVFVVLFFIYRERLEHFFTELITNTNSLNTRWEGYRSGIAQFRNHPIFGGTFYPLDTELYEWSSVEAFSAFFPARWHNTFVQLAASAGVVGLAAYVYHRAQTIALFVRKPSVEVLYIAVSVGTLLLTSMLDCHFFNIGPTLFYAMALAFAEHCISAPPYSSP